MAAETFQKYLNENKIEDIEILFSAESTHTAQEAADAHMVSVSNIVKSLLITDGKGFMMVLVPGDKRLDLKMVATQMDLTHLRMSTPDEAKSKTGYSIGGIPPFGYTTEIPTYVVEGFDIEETLVAAAGSANSVFKLSYDRLLKLTNGEELSG